MNGFYDSKYHLFVVYTSSLETCSKIQFKLQLTCKIGLTCRGRRSLRRRHSSWFDDHQPFHFQQWLPFPIPHNHVFFLINQTFCWRNYTQSFVSSKQSFIAMNYEKITHATWSKEVVTMLAFFNLFCSFMPIYMELAMALD